MECTQCKDLNQALEAAQSKYIAARFSAFYRVSTDIAANRQVDMERAKTDRDEHCSVCPSVVSAYRAAA